MLQVIDAVLTSGDERLLEAEILGGLWAPGPSFEMTKGLSNWLAAAIVVVCLPLSATAAPDVVIVSRIGSGPWHNANGVMVASSVADLHSDNVNLTKETQTNESGGVVNGRGDDPNRHDILTGSNLDGTVYPAGDGYDNCGNWTGNGEGSTRVGHHDRIGGGENNTSWNSAHPSRGCGQSDLQGTGGDGLFYCFGSAGMEQPAKP